MANTYLTLYELRLWNHWDDLPETIVIGINQRNNRMEDCRFNRQRLTFGKGAFFEFIGGELLPYIEKKKIPHCPFKIIAGHDTSKVFFL
jgi:hypothetical protein